MAIEGITSYDQDCVSATAAGALVSGQVLQAPDGMAAVYAGLKAAAAGDAVALYTGGVREINKLNTVVLLAGQEVWWDIANNRATYRADGDFYVGVAVKTATPTATTVFVRMNAKPSYAIELADGEWIADATLGLGVTTLTTGGVQLAFDAVAEIAQAAYHSSRTVDVDDGPILEAEAAVFDIGDAAALDMDIGLASATHASDFEAIAAFVSFHFDGSSLNIIATSDDGTTDVTPIDTTVDAVDDTYLFLQIDATDKTDVQLYINGVNVLPSSTFTLEEYASTLKAIALIEKTSDDTTADLRIRRMTVRTAAGA